MTSLHTPLFKDWSRRVMWLICLISLCWSGNTLVAAPIDEFRISAMEQRIRELESTAREQARLITQLLAQTGKVVTVAGQVTAIDNPALK